MQGLEQLDTGSTAKIDSKLKSNADLLHGAKSKIAQIEKILAQKDEPACDADCKKKCDQEADTMIRELKNPLHEITWNCKNNFDTYTTDYDPDFEHVDRMT